MKVDIPFQERWREAMLSGTKQCTSRTKRYGKAGDTFDAFGATFTIEYTTKLSLELISSCLYKAEGCDSPDDFQRVWEQLHPRKGFVSDEFVFAHWFKRQELPERR